MNLPATILLNSLVCENYPEIVERIKLRKDDVCSHGRTNAETLGGLWEHDEARIIAESTETITKHFGVRPTGWMLAQHDQHADQEADQRRRILQRIERRVA